MLKGHDRMQMLDARFEKAFRYLGETDLDSLPLGSTIDLGGGVAVFVKDPYVTAPIEEKRFEQHYHHFDIQYVAEGEEFIGVAPAEGLEPITEHDAANDVIFRATPEKYSRVVLSAGDVCVLAPEEAHCPTCAVDGPVRVRKIIVKIEV